MHESIWGGNAAYRRQMYAESAQADKDFDAVDKELTAIRNFVGPLSPQQEAHKKDVERRWNEALNKVNSYYQKYRALPEEKDAWDVGNAFGASC